MSRRCILCRVSGRVQGVFFRQSTREEAWRLGVTGHAINLPDGSVEVLACGDETALKQLRAFLKIGPGQARVDGLECVSCDAKSPSGFTTG